MNKVSVIIPNYNYADLLPGRLASIINQTIKPAEIIFLDDSSTDNSVEIAEEILSRCDIPYRIIQNETNQGVFKQWLKGIDLVENEIFWIAESDDYCELNFLETLLPAFEDNNVILSYCQSNYIVDGKIAKTHKDEIALHMDASRWNESYTNSCIDEAENYLSAYSTIANASAVLIRKNAIDAKITKAIADFNMAGDWLFYILLLFNNPNSKISYHADPLNYFVQQSKSIYNKNSATLPYYEILKIYTLILNKYQLPQKTQGNIFNGIKDYYLGVPVDDSKYSKLVSNLLLKSSKYYIPDYIEFSSEKILRLNNEILRLNNEIQKRDSDITNLSSTLNTIYNSKGWRYLTRFYRAKAKFSKLKNILK